MKKILLMTNVMFISTSVFGMKMQIYLKNPDSFKGLKRIESTQNLRGKYEQNFLRSENNRVEGGLEAVRAENISSKSKQRTNVAITQLNDYLTKIYWQSHRSSENTTIRYDNSSQSYDSEKIKRKTLQFSEEQLYAAIRSIKFSDIESLKQALNYLDTSCYGQLLLFACQYRCLIKSMPSFAFPEKLREAENFKEQLINDLIRKIQKGASHEVILVYQKMNREISKQIAKYNSLNHLSNRYLSSERKARDLQENFRIINLLFSHPNTDTKIKNQKGKTAIDVLIEAKEFDIVKRLRKNRFGYVYNSPDFIHENISSVKKQESGQSSFAKITNFYKTLKQFLKIRKGFQ